MKKDQFLQLVDKYLSGRATEEEERLLIRFFDSFQADEDWNSQLTGVKQELEERMLQRLMQSVRQSPPGKRPLVRMRSLFSRRNIAAAILLCLLGAGSLYYYTGSRKKESAAVAIDSRLKPATGNKALLRLANGTTIELARASSGVLAQQGNTLIKKAADGQLIYEPGSNDRTGKGALNTITIPKGGQYQLTLPDGTRVWLNAGSSLTFPFVFDSLERRVMLKGEAYFEVAKVFTRDGSRLPFYVKTGESEVAVSGTHFNVKDYGDAAGFEATLLEGAVTIKHGSAEQKITPGQQASIARHSSSIKVNAVNTEIVMAWKEGLFLFDDTPIDKVMEDIRRWYDVEVVYEGSKPDVEFTGVLPRSSSVAQVLHLLESAQGVQFIMNGNRIIVRSK